MKRIALFAALTLTLTALASPSAAQEWRRTPTGWASGDITHTLTLPVGGAGAVGGTVHGDLLFVTTWTAFSIFDISNPRLPVPLSTTPGFRFINEGPVTNGEILLVMNDFNRELQIWDVTDPRLPERLSVVAPLPTPEHIWTCILDCDYAYGSGGAILDLRDPASPRFVRDWRQIAPIRIRHGMGTAHDGLVFTGSVPQHVFDTTSPEDPKVVATIEPPSTFFTSRTGPPGNRIESLISYVDWNGEDRVALTTVETPFSGACNESSGGLVTYDTHKWEKTGTFGTAGVYRITETGTPDRGLLPENAIGCGPLGLDAHPDYRKGGTVAVGWAEHGVRLFDVDKKGAITEAGGFMPDGGSAFMPIWVTDEILYSIDTTRGLDIYEVGTG